MKATPRAPAARLPKTVRHDLSRGGNSRAARIRAAQSGAHRAGWRHRVGRASGSPVLRGLVVPQRDKTHHLDASDWEGSRAGRAGQRSHPITPDPAFEFMNATRTRHNARLVKMIPHRFAFFGTSRKNVIAPGSRKIDRRFPIHCIDSQLSPATLASPEPYLINIIAERSCALEFWNPKLRSFPEKMQTKAGRNPGLAVLESFAGLLVMAGAI